MKNSILVILLLFSFASSGQEAKKLGVAANRAYDEGNFTSADSLYDEGLRLAPQWNELVFNRGDALYRQGDFEGAAETFESVAEKLDNPQQKAEAYHNLGNAHLSMQQFDKAAAAYRRALLNNPNDEDTRYNLAYAQKMLRQQEQNKDQNQEQNQDQDQNKDEKGDQDQQDQSQEGQDDQKKDGEQEKEQNQDGEQQGENDQENGDKQQEQQQNQDGGEQKQEQGEESKPLKLSKEDAARILESLKQNEREIQGKLQRKKGKGKKVKIEKDW